MATDTEEIPEYMQTTVGGYDDLNITFRDPFFGYNPAYVDQDGNMALALIVDMETDDSGVGDNGVLLQQVISIGKGWVQVDGGKRVERENGRAKGFQRQTYLGVLVDLCMELGRDEMMAHFRETGLQPNDAGFWDGFQAHMSQRPMPVFREGEKPKTKLLPDEWVRWEKKNEKAVGAKKAAKKAVKKAAPAPKYEAGAGGGGDSVTVNEPSLPATSLLPAIVQIARSASTDEEFIVRCYDEVEGLDDDTAAMALVDDVESAGCVWLTYGPGGARHDQEEASGVAEGEGEA